ncbi:uncharacterized protein LOC117574433 [Drosophila albomicans]|uniref:Glycerol-3-phosphate dehydrogenase [NAD(+)] n=1 Tax=Drosophila albomicans TaxID=7291 RepID=A0A6P8ZC35_DROAB|nr:uncharacterized protein LOC117574433 [Drosophila albomicans]
MSRKPKVCIIGAEGWGSAISTAVCKNAANGEFDKNVHIYVYDELVRSNYLSEVINERHENIKYLPGIKLELNLIAVNDLIEAAKEADVLIFATSHSFIKPYCNILAGKVKTSAYAVSLIKGLDHIRDGEIDLYSHVISKQLNIPCYSMMSANSAMEMAQGKLTEITIGCNNANHAHQLSNLFQTDNCKVCSVDDVDGVELCNTLKDLVALSAGFIDGLRLGENARVTCLHLALKEMMRFIKTFNPNTKLSTFFESCGLANSVASSYADKNVTFAKCFVTSRKTVQEIEANLLNGRKLLGPIIAGEIYAYLEKAKLQDKYPLFTVLHRICQNELPPDAIVDTLRWHPDLSNNSITQLQKDEYKLPISFADSVLENFVDVAPELRPWSDNAKSVDSSIDSNIQEEKVQQIFNVENSKMENSGMEATTALDAAKPNKSDVEFSFEIASSEDKPEIYLTLREGTGNPSIEVPEQNGNPWLYQQNQDLDIGLDNAIGISQNLNNDTSAEYLSIKRQPAEIAHSNESKSSEGRPVVGVSNFIKQHINPLNEKYKALKVRAKVNDSIKASKLKKKLSKSNLSKKEKSTEKIQAKENDSKSKSNEMENLKSHYKSPVQKQKQQGALAEQQKMQVLYDEDPTFTKRSADEPSVSKLFDIMRMNASRSYEEELIGHSLNANVQSKSKKNKFSKRNKVMDKASNTMPIIKEGGYRVDYKRVLRSNKKPSPIKEHKSNQSKDNETKIASIVHKVDRVPLQYSNTDNSYRSIKSDLESQSCSEAKYQPTDNDQLNQQKEDKTVFKTLAMAPMSSKGNDSICPEMLYFDGQKNMKGFEEDPKLKYEGKRTENIHDAFKDPNKLIRAQEFLDEQSHLIRNLLLEVAASDSFNNDLTKYLQSENEFLDNKTKNESKCADQKNSPLEEQKPDHAQKFTSEPKIKEYQLTHGEPKSEISIEKPQSNKQLPAFDRMPTREHLDYTKKEEENKMKYINNVYEDVRDSSDEEILNNNKVLLEKQFPDKGDNKSLIQDKYEMILEKHLPNRDYKSLSDKRDTLLDKSVSKAYDTGLNEFYNSSVDESVEGNSKNFDDHRSSALIKKNQIRGLEDPNLRFYHGKNDGEPGPEWNWLLENEDTKKKSKNSVKNTENRSLDLDDDLLVDSKKQPKNSLKKTGNRNLELDEDLAQHNYQNQFSNEDKQTSRKSMNPTNNNNFSQDLNFPQRSQENSDLNIEEDQALDKAQFIIDEDAQKPIETDGSSPVKFEGKPNEIFMDDANPISKSLSEESSQDTKTSDPIKSKHTDNEDAEVILKDMSAEETLQTDRTVSGLNDKEYEVMAHAVNEFKKILDDVEVKFNSPDALEKNMKQPIDERLAESLHQDEENPEFNTEMKTLMTKGQTKERQVDYSGNDPYFENINTLPKRSTPSHSKDEQGEKMRKKIVIRPSFHPPINPRVRIPHPPFDVRDHEYHTVNYRPPPNLMRSATLPLRKIPVAYRTKQTAASNVVKLPRPAMRLPTSVMRSSVLAVELGIFAAFFSRYRGGCK